VSPRWPPLPCRAIAPSRAVARTFNDPANMFRLNANIKPA
jgi:hypothetical protein